MAYPIGQFDFHHILTEHIVKFWERCVDYEHGGYNLDIDEKGNVKEGSNRHLTGISRMIFSFSVGYRMTKQRKYWDLATHGVEYVKRYFYDSEYKGFFLLTNCNGKVLDDCKSPYAIASAVYALSEYYRSTGTEKDSSILELAEETMSFLIKYAQDHVNGGVYENLDSQWHPISRIKRAGHLIHLLEATSNMYSITQKESYKNFLIDICDVLATRFYDADNGCLIEHFTELWEPYSEITKGTILYGHVLEASWFFMAVGQKLQKDNYCVIGRLMLAHAMQNGWDNQYGGIYYSGWPNGNVVDTTKMWWAQCAFIGALSTAFSQTDDPLYASWLEEAMKFFKNKQLDSKHGELYMLLHRDGTVYSGLKGKAAIDFLPIKGAYHVVQALDCAIRRIECRNQKLSEALTALCLQDEVWL